MKEKNKLERNTDMMTKGNTKVIGISYKNKVFFLKNCCSRSKSGKRELVLKCNDSPANNCISSANLEH